MCVVCVCVCVCVCCVCCVCVCVVCVVCERGRERERERERERFVLILICLCHFSCSGDMIRGWFALLPYKDGRAHNQATDESVSFYLFWTMNLWWFFFKYLLF